MKIPACTQSDQKQSSALLSQLPLIHADFSVELQLCHAYNVSEIPQRQEKNNNNKVIEKKILVKLWILIK